MLYPFWGEVPVDPNDPDVGRFDDYIDRGKEFFDLVASIEECDIAILPFEYSFEQSAMELTNKIAESTFVKNKKLVVFYNTDHIYPINIPNSIIFRTSFLKYKQKENEFAFSCWTLDFVKNYAKSFSTLSKKEKPEISYCGYVDFLESEEINLIQRIKEIFKKTIAYSYEEGTKIRGKAVRLLQNDNRIIKKFIIRKGFWAPDVADKKKARVEYAQNMLNSPYGLVVRGAGNFSYRLNEVMGCGRIPVFINTDCVLPFDTILDWKKFGVWIEEKEIKKIGDKIINFHNSISENEFIKLQIQNRKIYEEYLCPVGFFKNLHLLLN